MVLPNRDLRTAQEDVLSSFRDSVLLFNLDLDNVAWMLDNLADVRLVLSPDLTGKAFGQVNESSNEPVFPKDTNSSAEGGSIRLDHAEGAMERPEKEEEKEEVMGVPESFKVSTSGLLHSSSGHQEEDDKHDVTRPSWTSQKVCHEETLESEALLGGKLCEIIPVGDSVNNREEDNRPCSYCATS